MKIAKENIITYFACANCGKEMEELTEPCPNCVECGHDDSGREIVLNPKCTSQLFKRKCKKHDQEIQWKEEFDGRMTYVVMYCSKCEEEEK